jgi:glycine/D-amino acid oxidase-like deaminating enzyme
LPIAIAGGGVIGACIAYYLSLRGAAVTLIERHRIAGSASGKSGGFLALDWCDGSPLAPLARRSFALHAELADTLNNPFGYRRLDTYSVVASERRRLAPPLGASRLPWLREEAMVQGRLGGSDSTAQVIPAAFTETMVAKAVEQGAEVVSGEVAGIALDRDRRRVQGVRVGSRLIEADRVVIAMGPWSALARRWLPLPEVFGLKGHSLIFKEPDPVPAEALFVEFEAADGGADTPELFPRPDGTVYLCGLSSQEPLPLDPATITSNDASADRLRAIGAALSPALADAEILASQACYRPVTRDGLPLMGEVPGVEGAYVATGHSVWGILNAPASGLAMAELILEGAAASVDLTPFAPGRFMA